MYFVKEVSINNYLSFKELFNFCLEIENRRRIDKNLKLFLEKHSEYNFIEGKKAYDSLNKRY